MVQGEWRALIRQPPTRLPVFLLALFLLDYFSYLSQVRSLALQYLDQNAIAAIQSPHSTQRTSRLSIPLLYFLRMRLNLAEGNFFFFFWLQSQRASLQKTERKTSARRSLCRFSRISFLVVQPAQLCLCLCLYLILFLSL
jgi:hypothetical protein